MNFRRYATDEPSANMVDAVFEGYVAWRERSAALQTAYDSWCGAGPRLREAAFADYLAALDREEWAAARYEWLIERASDCRNDGGRGSASLDFAA